MSVYVLLVELHTVGKELPPRIGGMKAGDCGTQIFQFTTNLKRATSLDFTTVSVIILYIITASISILFSTFR